MLSITFDHCQRVQFRGTELIHDILAASSLWHSTFRNEDGNQMSLTMVLRRSPDLDIETLGGMGLVSSSNLKGPEEAQIEEESLEHVVSNDSNPHKDVTHLQQLHSKLVPRPRHAAMPYAIHLKDFTPVPWHDGLHMAETAHTNHARSEALNKAQPTPLWHSALHASHESEGAAQAAVTGSSTKGSQQVAAVAQQAKQKKRYVHMCRWYPHIHARDARAAFDLYQPSAKLVLECSRQPVLQPRAAAVSGADDAEPGSSHEDQHQAEGAADVAVDAEAVGCDLAYSAECGESLAMHSCTDATRTSTEPATEPAVDSVIASLGNGQSNPQSAAESAVQSASEAVSESAAEAVAATAADPAADPAADLAADPAQGSYSMQQPGLDADPLLPHKSSSVRFLVALDSCTSSEATVNSAAVSPEPTVALISACVAVPSEVSQEQLGSAVKGKHGMQTVSSVSSSLKSSLKSARSSLSTVGSHGMSHGSMQLGVNFARDDGEGDDDDAHPSMAKSAIARGASDAFPAWLTEGYAANKFFEHLACVML